MRIEAATAEEYFANSGEREPILREIDTLIRRAAPSFDREMVSGMAMNMIGYGMFTYRNKSGKEQAWPVIALANQKHYVSIYVSALENGQYIAEKYADQLGMVSVGKSCIRFKKLEDINLEQLEQIISSLQARRDRDEVVYGF